jgi:hypothetical protein
MKAWEGKEKKFPGLRKNESVGGKRKKSPGLRKKKKKKCGWEK